MHSKRFSKLLLVVLALALWAGTAYGQSSFFSASPGAPTLTYIRMSGGSQPAASQIMTITNNDTIDHTFYATSVSNQLDVTTAACQSPGTLVTAGSSISCTIAVDETYGNAAAASTYVGQSVQMYADGSIDQTFSLTVVINPPVNSSQSTVSLTYTIGSGASVSQTDSISSSGVVESYTFPHAGCPAWLSFGSSNTSQTPDTLTISVVPTGGSGADSASPVASSCTASLTDASGFIFQTLTINYTLLAPVVFTSSGSDITLASYRLHSAAVVSSTYTPTAAANATGFNVVASSTGNWLTVAPLSGSANIAATGTQLTIGVNDTNADALSVGTHDGTITLTPTGTGQTLIITVHLPVQAASAFTVTSPVALGSYSTGTETVLSTTSTPTANYDGTTYTAASDVAWLTVTSGTQTANTVATGGSSTLTFTLVPAQADTLAAGTRTAHITLTPTSGATASITVNLTVVASTLTSNPTTLTLGYTTGGASVTGTQTANLTAGGAGVNYTSQSDASWLTVSSATGVAGTTATQLTYNVNVADGTFAAFGVGAHSGHIKFYVENVAAIAATVTVTVNIVAPSTLSASPSTLTFTNYTRGGTAPTAVHSTITDSNVASDTDSVLASSVPAWLSCAVTGTVSGSISDTLNCTVVTGPSGADALNAGPQTANVHIQVAGQADTVVTVNLTIVSAVSPLTVSPAPITLTFLIGGGGSQTKASQVANITSTDQASDAYTIVAPTGQTLPNWLTLSKTSGSAKVGNGNSDSVTFSLATANVPVSAASSTTITVLFHIDQYNPDRAVTVTMNVVAQPMTATPSSVSLTYSKSGSTGNPVGVTIGVLPGNANLTYSLDLATVPVWLTVGLPNPASTANAAQVNFSVTPNVPAGMATGNYTASVGLKPTSGGYSSELIIPVSFTISNTAAGLSFKEGTGPVNVTWAPGMTTPPVPTFTPMSSNEPIPFTATCTVTPSDAGYAGSTPCTLSSTSGVAYTWGAQLTAALDPVLFTGSTLGNTVTVSVTVHPTGAGNGSNITLVYIYSLNPVSPVITNSVPTQAAHIPTGTNLVVTLTGTGFVGPGSIKTGTIVPTQVYLGSSTVPLASSSYVVLSPTVMMVTIPESAFPTLSGGKTSNLNIGVANQTTSSLPSGPTNQWPLVITTTPVIYGFTSTASYVQPNPTANPPANLPVAAPYDLVSIFGDNFGPTGTNYLTATPTNYGQVPTSLTLSGSGKTAVNLTVGFLAKNAKTAVLAPVLFASQTQINVIVPSGITLGSNTVIVTSGASTNVSDGKFQINAVAADPGIFTLASDGVGQGAIENLNLVSGTVTINSSGAPAARGSWISIFMTGLGTPDSTALDMGSYTTSFPANCVAISNTGKNTPGYLQVMNTSASATGYTAPSPAWSTIDGAVIDFNPAKVKLIPTGGLPPCFTSPVTVSFGPAGNQVTSTTAAGTVTYAGFVDGAVAGLYQINVQVPPGAPTGAAVAVSVTLGTYTSPAVTMAIN